ncbi:MAG: hypothetical protein DRG78_15355 [Epsilonproteobacteria bacterium]|nr:MAG: hypothetical protein DRG78_15355 [Campylobacterota bacterium]
MCQLLTGIIIKLNCTSDYIKMIEILNISNKTLNSLTSDRFFSELRPLIIAELKTKPYSELIYINTKL